MHAGRKNKRVTIQAGEQTKGPSGGTKTEWVDVITVMANVNDTGGSRQTATKASGGEYVENQVVVTISYRRLPPLVRIVQESPPRVLTVDSVGNPWGKNRELVLKCTDGIRGNT